MVDCFDEPDLHDLVDRTLHWVKLECDGFLVVLRKFEDRSTQQFIIMGPSDHDIVQIAMKALVVDLAPLQAVVLSENLEGTGAWDLGM